MEKRPLLYSVFIACFALLWWGSGEKVTPNAVSNLVMEQWVDSVYNTLTEDERIGQLFMLRAHSNLGQDHIDKVKRQIREYHVGGLCFFQGTPEKQVALINEYQKLAGDIPLMISMDAEFGLGMRMKASTIRFPYQLTLGAIQDNNLIYKMGEEIADQLHQVGTHVNFAPVADVNNNAANPVINFRSFGEDRYNVSVKSYMYMKGMQDHNILACAKHFPGHGDTDTDSHLDLPVITHDWERLDSIELYPFRTLAQHGIGSFMIAHLHVPTLDARENRPTTLSYNTVTRLLKDGIGFDGLVFTDAMDMKGVTKHHGSGEVEAEALLAGADILLLPEDLAAALKTIKQYVAEGKIKAEALEERVKRVLRAKYKLGLTSFTPIATDSLRTRLNNKKALALKEELYENALTLVRNPDKLLPFDDLQRMNLASVSIGVNNKTPFQKRLDSYAEVKHFQLPKELSAGRSKELVNQLKDKTAVIVSLHDMSLYPKKNYGITQATRSFLTELKKVTKVVLVVFGNPYSLRYFDDIDYVLEAYEDDPLMQNVAAQGLFGALPIRGRLPVTVSPKSKYNMGVTTKRNYKMGYNLPERKGLSSEILQGISMLTQNAIDSGAMPGCVVLVAKEGSIVYEQAFGHQTYKKKQSITTDAIYDLASITKIAAATLAVMHLHERGKVSIDEPISTYLPSLTGSNKANMTLRDIMAHRAGLRPWIPFYEQTITSSRRNPKPQKKFYRNRKKGDFSVPVTQSLFMHESFVDTIWSQIITSELRDNTNYRYSDLGFYLIAQLVEQLEGVSIDQYVAEHFYEPLGLHRTTYLPWTQFKRTELIPTEEDRYFRRQRIQGYVHDMGAAMLGGISGHAGLFSTAEELAILMQMLLQGGFYGGKQYLKPSTIQLFTQRHPNETRRGIGFDMMQLDTSKAMNVSPLVSERTFGHLGFTGTSAWADPEHDLIYIFLSNRTYPSMYNYKLGKMNIRPRIQDIVYQALLEEAG
ncbi:MAG: glycoside hydrolase family 3 N-terminal domain-containing protein [Bacteroidota bacterium]